MCFNDYFCHEVCLILSDADLFAIVNLSGRQLALDISPEILDTALKIDYFIEPGGKHF